MTKQEIMTRIDQAEQQLSELKAELERLEKEPTFERVAKGNSYCTIKTNVGQLLISECIEAGSLYDMCCHYYNNYFHKKDRAQEVADKIKFLLKMERYHDIYCPNYKPNWDDYNVSKWYVLYNVEEEEYQPFSVYYDKGGERTYFLDRDTAQAVCDRLNEELKHEGIKPV